MKNKIIFLLPNFFFPLFAGKQDLDCFKIIMVKKQGPTKKQLSQQRSNFIESFNNASKERKIEILECGIFTNPEDGHLWPWAQELNSEGQQQFWGELKDIPVIWGK